MKIWYKLSIQNNSEQNSLIVSSYLQKAQQQDESIVLLLIGFYAKWIRILHSESGFSALSLPTGTAAEYRRDIITLTGKFLNCVRQPKERGSHIFSVADAFLLTEYSSARCILFKNRAEEKTEKEYENFSLRNGEGVQKRPGEQNEDGIGKTYTVSEL